MMGELVARTTASEARAVKPWRVVTHVPCWRMTGEDSKMDTPMEEREEERPRRYLIEGGRESERERE